MSINIEEFKKFKKELIRNLLRLREDIEKMGNENEILKKSGKSKIRNSKILRFTGTLFLSFLRSKKLSF